MRIEATELVRVVIAPALAFEVLEQCSRFGGQRYVLLRCGELDHAQNSLGEREPARECPCHDAELDEGEAVLGDVERLKQCEEADADPLDRGRGHPVDAPFFAVDAEEVRDATRGREADGAGVVGGGGVEVGRRVGVGAEEAEYLHYGRMVEEAGRGVSSVWSGWWRGSAGLTGCSRCVVRWDCWRLNRLVG